MKAIRGGSFTVVTYTVKDVLRFEGWEPSWPIAITISDHNNEVLGIRYVGGALINPNSFSDMVRDSFAGLVERAKDFISQL
jgi:hypothetical protein